MIRPLSRCHEVHDLWSFIFGGAGQQGDAVGSRVVSCRVVSCRRAWTWTCDAK